jgi:hypothetical protein
MPELNTLSPKKWVGNYSGAAPTIDTTDGVLVGDLAIDNSTTPYTVWQCSDNTDTAPVWNKMVKSGPFEVHYKALGADKVIGDGSSTGNTLVDVPGLDLTLAAGKTYWFTFNLWFKTSATTVGAFFTVNGSQAATKVNWQTRLPLGRNVADDIVFYGDTFDEGVVSTSLANLTGGTNQTITVIKGVITNAGTASAFTLRARAETAAGVLTIYKNSTLEITKVD